MHPKNGILLCTRSIKALLLTGNIGIPSHESTKTDTIPKAKATAISGDKPQETVLESISLPQYRRNTTPRIQRRHDGPRRRHSHLGTAHVVTLLGHKTDLKPPSSKPI
ncbi:hypothetical protein FALCPG4_002487 [Fusarium falciforme]